MDKVIPILPCPDIRAQTEFYEHLGFEILSVNTSPNAYLAIRRGDIELHFWGSRKNVPAENPTMCVIQTEDVDAMCADFTNGLKSGMGRTPREGIPRVSKVRDLKDDRRFTLVDPGGNTFYICTPTADRFFRTLDSEIHAKSFAVLYDLLYSKEDPALAENVLPRLMAVKDELSDLDKAKLLLMRHELMRQQGREPEAGELAALLECHDGEGWNRIRDRYKTVE